MNSVAKIEHTFSYIGARWTVWLFYSKIHFFWALFPSTQFGRDFYSQPIIIEIIYLRVSFWNSPIRKNAQILFLLICLENLNQKTCFASVKLIKYFIGKLYGDVKLIKNMIWIEFVSNFVTESQKSEIRKNGANGTSSFALNRIIIFMIRGNL